MSDAIIQVRQLRKVYRIGKVEVEALRGIDLDVRAGEFVAIVGPSGSGKSTLFHVMGGLTPPTSGSVEVAGMNLTSLTDAGRTRLRQRCIGFVFQKFNLLPTLTAADNIRLGRYLGKNSGIEDGEFAQLLRALGIAGRLGHKPAELSGGEQQRVAIARALVNRPAILLADEPTGNLDSANSEAVLGILRDLNERSGQTILMITHNADAAAYAHRTIHMGDGKIRQVMSASPVVSC